MRIKLPVTPATLPRLAMLRAATPAGSKPPTFELPEADAARDARLAHGDPRPPPGRWLVADVGRVVATPGSSQLEPVYTVEVEVLEYVAPAARRYGLPASR